MNDEAVAPLKGIPPPTPGPKMPPRKKVQFTEKDANDIINLVNRAPLQNMREAGAVAQLLQRFQQWYLNLPLREPAENTDSTSAPPADKAEQPADASSDTAPAKPNAA